MDEKFFWCIGRDIFRGAETHLGAAETEEQAQAIVGAVENVVDGLKRNHTNSTVKKETALETIALRLELTADEMQAIAQKAIDEI